MFLLIDCGIVSTQIDYHLSCFYARSIEFCSRAIQKCPVGETSRSRCLVARGLSHASARGRERWRGTGPRPTVKGGRFFIRARGLSPANVARNAADTVARGPVPRERWGVRTMARDRPSPYGNPGRFFTVDPFGIRRARTTVSYRVRARRGTGPRPTVIRDVFFTVARGPVPRDRCMARGTRSHARVACEGPSPTVTQGVFYS